MHRFHVAALPRSGTTWLSTWLDTRPVVCHHDACQPGYTKPPAPGWCVAEGNVDTLLNRDIRGPLLVVLRRPLECAHSMQRAFPYMTPTQIMGIIDKANLNLRSLRRFFTPMVVPYENMFDIGMLEKMWAHLIPMVPFDAGRTERLLARRVVIREGRS